MVYCNQCGCANLETDRFCSKCGSPLRQTPLTAQAGPKPVNPVTPGKPADPAPQERPNAERVQAKKKNPVNALVIILTVSVLVLGGLVAGGIFGWNAWQDYQHEKLALAYMEAYYSADSKAIVKMLPKKAVEALADRIEGSKADVEDAIESNLFSNLEEGSYEFGTLAVAAYSETGLENLQEDMEATYDLEVEAAVYVWTCYQHRDTAISSKRVYTLICVDGQWYISPDTVSHMVQ